MTMQRITAGIDHSPAARTALQWASDLASASEVPLRVLHAWQIPLLANAPELMGALPDESTLAERAEEFVDKELAEIGATEAERLVVHGSAGVHLAEQSDEDTLVVVGRTGRGARALLARIVDGLLGSASRYVVHHNDGPVAVVPSKATWTDAPRVIVGVDETASSHAALRWAVESLPADARIVAMRFIIPWVADPLVPVDDSFNPQLIARAENELRAWVSEVVAASTNPDRNVDVDVDLGAASWALTTASRDADLVVVGHRDRSALANRLLGSVADHAVRHSHAPVIVVPEPAG